MYDRSTPHYHLPQYYGDDKPDWSDLTKAFGIIDDVLYSLQIQIDKQGRDIEEELRVAVQTLNTRIDNETAALNDRIDNEVATINQKIDNEVATINQRIGDEVTTINQRIDDEIATIDARIIADLTNAVYWDEHVSPSVTSDEYSHFKINK